MDDGNSTDPISTVSISLTAQVTIVVILLINPPVRVIESYEVKSNRL